MNDDVVGPDPSSAQVGPKMGAATLRDVAQLAGVSVSTASLVVNKKPGARISEATRQRVLDAVEQLGYRPNALAKSLVRGSSQFIGIVSDAISTTPFAGAIIRGAQEEAWRHGYVLLIADTDEVPEASERSVQMMFDHQAIGILYSTWRHRAVEPPAALYDMPTVLVNCFAESAPLPAVVPDEEQGGRAATEIILDSGHQDVVFINSSETAVSTAGRARGFRAAIEDAGLTFTDDMIYLIDPGPNGDFAEAGYDAASEIFQRANRPTALFCYNDRTAMGVYAAAAEFGIRIPEDVAIVGFDDQEVIAAHLRPKLTTVALPHYELGVLGVRTLLNHIGEKNPVGGIERVACPPVIRESV